MVRVLARDVEREGLVAPIVERDGLPVGQRMGGRDREVGRLVR